MKTLHLRHHIFFSSLGLLSALFALSRCGSTPVADTKPADAGAVVASNSETVSRQPDTSAETLTTSPETPEKAALRAQAQAFDRLVLKIGDEDERAAAARACQAGEKNLFCSTIVKLDDYFDQGTSGLGGHAHHRRSRGVRPHFNARGKLMNWKALHTQPAAALLESFGRLHLAQLKEVRKAALVETECPNGPAIAVAASLESHLPDDTSFEDLAYLFEKGAACLEDQPADVENLYTRAGLFHFAAKNYADAEKAFQKSIASDTFIARSLYWLYRTQLALGATDKASATLDQLVQKYPFSFHTLVATTATNKDPGETALKTGGEKVKRSATQTAINDLIAQVEVLQSFDFKKSASKLLDWAIRASNGTEPEVLLYLAELKDESGDQRSKIFLMSDVLYKYPNLISKETMELYFPKVYFPIFEKQSSRIDPYFLIAVARRESAFDVRAMSPARAKGLMQVLPTTARHLRHKRTNLFDPDQNVEVGTRYLTTLLKKLDGQAHLALAAYNAGPGKVMLWTGRYPTEEPILFIDLIPYRETREYVASILRNYYWYRRIHQTGEKLTYRQLLELAIAKGG